MIQISCDKPTFFSEKLRRRIVRRIFRIKDILVGSPYRVNITLKNTGAQTFNGGALVISAISLLVLMIKDVVIPIIIWFANHPITLWLFDALKWLF
jgi:hypothetical protein